MSYFEKYINLILEQNENQQIIVYLDMDGVLADFGGMKKQMILKNYREDFLDLIKHVNLTEKEREIFLTELASNSKDTSLLDSYGKPKISRTAIKKGESKFWKIIKEIHFFEKLKPLYNNELIKKIYELKNKYDFKIGILGSTGLEENHVEFERQKREWLKKQGLLEYLDSKHIVFVPGKKYKSTYANPTSMLIDDTPINIENFNKNGGHGILHQNNIATLKKLKEILEEIKKI